MNKFLFHSSAVDLFRKRVYSNIYTIWDIKGDEKVINERLSNGDKVFYKGFEIKDQNTKQIIFLPSENVKDMPVKVKKTHEIVYSRKVYHIAKDVRSVKFPSDNSMGMRDWMDVWFPLEHTSPEDLMVAKFLIAASASNRAFTRICTGAGFGKDGAVDNLINITGKGRNVSTASPAKLFQLIGEGFTAFNEIGGFGGEKKDIFQDFFLNTGDASKTVYEHGTTGSDKTKSSADISEYGWCILHNVPEYYIGKGQLTFEQMFTPAVFDRVFPVLLRGGVKPKNNFMSPNVKFRQIVEEGMEDYKKWIGYFFWLKENIYKTECRFKLKDYDLTVPNRKEAGSRFWNSLTRIAVIVSLYANTQEEFDYWMDIIYERHKDYIKAVDDLGLLMG